MQVLDRYLLRELLSTFAAVALVLILVTMGGLVADLLGKIARGRLPAVLLLSQLGLRSVGALPLLLPLSVFLAVLLTLGRLYRDSEIAVLAAAGVGLARLARPVAWLALPAAFVVGLCSLWWGPAGLRLSQTMIDAANRSLLVAGLEPGRFIELPGRNSVVYLADMSPDGSRFEHLFVHTEHDGRVDVVTAKSGEMVQESQGGERYLRLIDGFRVEGEIGKNDYRMMRFARNDIRVPESDSTGTGDDEQRKPTRGLLASSAVVDRAELHKRIGAPLATLLLALLAIPLARSPPRVSRHGRLLVALLGYIVYQNFLSLGRAWLSEQVLPLWSGLWWVHLAALSTALWLLWRDSRLPRPRSFL